MLISHIQYITLYYISLKKQVRHNSITLTHCPFIEFRFHIHVQSVTHDCHKGGPVEQSQVKCGQDAGEGSCLDPSAVLEPSQGRSKGPPVKLNEEWVKCMSPVPTTDPTYHTTLLWQCISFFCPLPFDQLLLSLHLQHFP